jgi:hypothetical protein
MRPAVALADILEDDWDRTLFRGKKSLADQLGWTSYHTLRSKGSKSGYPDRTLVRDRILFVELKREKTHPTDDQVAWLDKLAGAGGECYLWRPSDLDEIAAVLSKRWNFFAPAHYTQGGLGADANPDWTPKSLWLPGVGRSDTRTQQTLNVA